MARCSTILWKKGYEAAFSGVLRPYAWLSTKRQSLMVDAHAYKLHPSKVIFVQTLKNKG